MTVNEVSFRPLAGFYKVQFCIGVWSNPSCNLSVPLRGFIRFNINKDENFVCVPAFRPLAGFYKVQFYQQIFYLTL